MAAKEEEIQRCEEILAHYHSWDKKTNPSEILLLLDESLDLFPKNEDDDKLYPIAELLDMYDGIGKVFLDSVYFASPNTFPESVNTVHRRQRFTLGLLLRYVNRNGPGTPYLKAFSMFAEIALNIQQSPDFAVRILQDCLAVVLNRVDRDLVQHPSDCTSMLKWLNRLSDVFISTSASQILLTEWEKYFDVTISLCKEFPGADSRVLVELYRLASSLIEMQSLGDMTKISQSRRELVNTFLEIMHPDRTVLDVLHVWLSQSIDRVCFAVTLLPHGIRLARQMPENAGTFLASLEKCLSSLEGFRFLLMMHMPDVMYFIEETASPESIATVKCLLNFLISGLQDEETQEVILGTKRWLCDQGVQITAESDFTRVESWQRRLILKAVQLFSVPSKVTDDGAWELANIIEHLGLVGLDPKRAELRPLLELWTVQYLDSRYSLNHRYNVFTSVTMNERISDDPQSLSTSNRIWMHDPSRYYYGIEGSGTARALARSVRGFRYYADPLERFDVDMILLMTWLRAPVMLQRLNTNSSLKLLNRDILRRLAYTIGPDKTKSLFHIYIG